MVRPFGPHPRIKCPEGCNAYIISVVIVFQLPPIYLGELQYHETRKERNQSKRKSTISQQSIILW